MPSPSRPQDSHVATHRRLRLKLTKAHLTNLVVHGGSVCVSRSMHLPLSAKGGVVAHVPKDCYRRAVKCVRAGRPWTLRMSPHDVGVSIAEEGSGFGDFIDGLKDFAKGALDVASKYILPAISFALELLPSSDPRILALKSIVKAVGEGATKLNKIVNHADECEEKAAEAQLGVAEAEEDLEEAKAAAKQRDLSADKKEEAARARSGRQEARGRQEGCRQEGRAGGGQGLEGGV